MPIVDTDAARRSQVLVRPAVPAGRTEISPWLWLVFPPLLVPAQILLRATDYELYRSVMRTESGYIENATFVFLVVAVLCGVSIVRRRRELLSPVVGSWFALLTLGCFYFAGEEVSWGQHLFGWGTPEVFVEHNAQAETNLHNIHGLLDQLPRNLLTLGALLGGVAAPIALRRRFERSPGSLLARVAPTIVCLPAALLAVTVALPEKIVEAAGATVPDALDIQPGETKEYYLALFLMIYMLSFRRRELAR